jgi:hypothetical protein
LIIVTVPIASRSTRSDLWLTLTVGAAAAVYVLVMLVFRLVEIFGGEDIAVPVRFAPADLAIESSSTATISVDEGVVRVSELPVATFVSVVLAAVLPAAASLVVIGCALVVFRRVLDGNPFAPGTARLVTISAFAILGGWMASGLFDTMSSNGALAVAAPENDTMTAIQISWLPFLAAMAVAALAVLMRSGEKMRADTEWLV